MMDEKERKKVLTTVNVSTDTIRKIRQLQGKLQAQSGEKITIETAINAAIEHCLKCEEVKK